MVKYQGGFVPLVYLTRGETLESVHFGAAAVVASEGRLMQALGDAHWVAFMRSTAKPFQALPAIEDGVHEMFGFSEREVAIMCASHSGTDEHVSVLRGMQAKIGIDERALQCGVHEPMHKPTARNLIARQEAPSPNRHNCSGKHTGMLAYAKMLNAPLETYLDRQHPVQQRILQTVAEMCALSPDEIALGTDGCSAPNFALPLYHAAYGLARLCDPRDLPPRRQAACRTIVDAMSAHPDMVAGPERFDTALMRVAGDKLIAKGGAEGYQGIGIRPGVLAPDAPGIGIAIKISDGDPKSRARVIVALELLRQLGVLEAHELAQLKAYGPQIEVLNWRKIHIGLGGPLF